MQNEEEEEAGFDPLLEIIAASPDHSSGALYECFSVIKFRMRPSHPKLKKHKIEPFLVLGFHVNDRVST